MTEPTAKTAPDLSEPRDAASLILVDRSGGEPKVLMGKRRPDQVFMPNKFVFPGGRVDDFDAGVPAVRELKPREVSLLCLEADLEPKSARVRAIAAAAIRETYEETGFLIGSAGAARTGAGDLPEPWSAFFSHGFLPDLGALTLIARAITPPGRPRRYDTRFFVADAGSLAPVRGEIDGELSGVDWLTIPAAHELDLPPITHVILEDLSDILSSGSVDAHRPMPFYRRHDGDFRRKLLTP